MDHWAIAAADKSIEEEEEALCCLVVSRSLEVRTMEKNLVYPFQGRVYLISSTIGVEEAENINTDDGINSWPVAVKVRLYRRIRFRPSVTLWRKIHLYDSVFIHIQQHLIHYRRSHFLCRSNYCEAK